MEGIELNANEKFAQIRYYPNYHVSNQGRVYNSKTKKFIGSTGKNGYPIVGLHNNDGQITCYVHNLVMSYFGPTPPEGKTEIDHINHIRDDNRVENLRWVSKSENQKNKSSSKGVSYEYFDEIPADYEDIIEVRDYGRYEFEDLYYANGYFYFDSGVNFRRLHVNFDKRGYAYVYAFNKNDVRTKIYYTMFKKIYGLN